MDRKRGDRRGGKNASGDISSGGRYDPAADTRISTITTGAPSARFNHAAIWTGMEMILWGFVLQSKAILDTGGRYSPFDPPPFPDVDGDGIRRCEGGCDDAEANVYPRAPAYCDGQNNDCNDPSRPALPASDIDGDMDGFAQCQGDCADIRRTVYPGEALDFRVSSSGVLIWSAPGLLGSDQVLYDVIRADYDPLAFVSQGPGHRVESSGGYTTALDAEEPQRIGWRIFFYLVRAQNGCGNGPASLGSSGSEMPAVNCP